MSDGSIESRRNRFSIQSKDKDKDWIVILRDLISPNRPIHVHQNKHFRLAISDKQIVDWLKSKGCVPNKTKTLTFPDVPDRYLPDFVRGYFDGDGSISISRYQKHKNNKTYNYNKISCYICSSNRDFIESFRSKLQKTKIKNSLVISSAPAHLLKNKTIGASKMYRVSFGDRTAICFTNWTHYNGHKISMPRKFELIKKARSILI